MTVPDLVDHLARFAGRLRARDVPVGMSDEIDAARALSVIDLFDRAEVRSALRATFRIRPRHGDVFDALFESWWAGRGGAAPHAAPAPALPSPRTGRPPPSSAAAESPLPERAPAGAATVEGDAPGYSPEALLRRKPFEEYTSCDLAAMEALLARLALSLATRKSRRLVPTRSAGLVDIRRSLRRAVATRGELLLLARRSRPIEEPRLVLLCDTSGSMDPHTRFLLTFVFSLKRVAPRAEVFAFNTELTRLTPWIAPGKVARTLDRLAEGVPDWAGGTRIGESLAEFVTRHQDSMVDGRTVVVILSDGLDRGDPAVLAGAMRAIHARARAVVWLNPLAGDPRYQPIARGMAAAMRFVDHFGTAHNLESLERLLPLLGGRRAPSGPFPRRGAPLVDWVGNHGDRN